MGNNNANIRRYLLQLKNMVNSETHLNADGSYNNNFKNLIYETKQAGCSIRIIAKAAQVSYGSVFNWGKNKTDVAAPKLRELKIIDDHICDKKECLSILHFKIVNLFNLEITSTDKLFDIKFSKIRK